MKIADRVKEKLTAKMQKGLTFEEVAEKLTMSSDELKAYLSYYSILNKLEKEIDKID
jgi:DNA-directed RNA polymerase sigma subunit (sigma70/sigma32)